MKIPVVTAAVLIAVAVGAPVASASQLIARNANDVALEVNRDGKALAHVSARRAKVRRRARLGRDQRGAVRVGPAAGRRSGSTTPAAGARSAPAGLEDVRERVHAGARAARRGSSPRAARPTARTGPSRAGSGRCPCTAIAAAAGRDAWELRLSHWTGPVPKLEVQLRLDVPPLPSDLRPADVPRPRASTASARRRRACRSTTTAATSTSTRSTPRTAPAGGGRTASSRITRREASATASTRTATGRRAAAMRYRATVIGPRRDAGRVLGRDAAARVRPAASTCVPTPTCSRCSQATPAASRTKPARL